MKKINILIAHVSYQASSGSFIKLLRNSQIYEFYIVGCDSIEKGFSSGSILVDSFYHINVTNDTHKYIERIKEIVKIENIDVIISAEEDDLVLFKENKIPQAIYEYIPNYNIFELFRDKHSATQALQQKGFYVPKTIINCDDLSLSKSSQIIKRKRVSSCSRGISIYNKSNLPKDFTFFSDEYITQEFIAGKMYTVDVFCDCQGRPHSIIPRYGLASKDGTTFKCIIEREESLIDICEQIYKLYCIPGLSNIQFIVADKPYFIELNPRSAATMIASSLASVNYLDLYISHFLYNEVLPTYEDLMKRVKWNSVISRYYQETIYYLGEL